MEEWFPVQGGTGEIHIQVSFKPAKVCLYFWSNGYLFSGRWTAMGVGANHLQGITHHRLVRAAQGYRQGIIREGQYCPTYTLALAPSSLDLFPTYDPVTVIMAMTDPSQVMQVRKRDTLRIYALKTIRKAHIVSRSEVTHTLAERTVLAKVNCPFIVPLKFSFQSTEKLYLVLAFVNGGELFHHLQREGRFNETRSRFYAAELLMALEHLHGFNVVYRYVPAGTSRSGKREADS